MAPRSNSPLSPIPRKPPASPPEPKANSAKESSARLVARLEDPRLPLRLPGRRAKRRPGPTSFLARTRQEIRAPPPHPPPRNPRSLQPSRPTANSSASSTSKEPPAAPAPSPPKNRPPGVIGEDGLEIKRVAEIASNLRRRTPRCSHPRASIPTNSTGPPTPSNSPTSPRRRPEKTTGGSPSSTPSTSTSDAPDHHPRSRQHPRPAPRPPNRRPRWSPDGKQIAFIGGLMSDQGATGGDIYVVPSAGRRTHL